MRRRSRAGGEPVKTRRRKTAARKRGNSPKIARHQGSSAAGLQAEFARIYRRKSRREALQFRLVSCGRRRQVETDVQRHRGEHHEFGAHSKTIGAAP